MQSQGNPIRYWLLILFKTIWIFDLSGNNFGCLPESIAQLSILNFLVVNYCMSLQSFTKLPLNLGYIVGHGCSSLEMVPDLLRPNSLFEPKLTLKLLQTDWQSRIHWLVFCNYKKVSSTLSLSLSHSSKHHALYVSGTLS